MRLSRNIFLPMVFLPLAVLLVSLPSLAQLNVNAPAVKLVPTSLTFGQQVIGTVSGGQNVTLTNSGTAPLSLTRIVASAGDGESNTCGTSVKAGNSCSITVNFAPTASGT